MLLDDAVQGFLMECQMRQYTWRTSNGYRKGLEFASNYLKVEHSLKKIEQV